MKRGRKYLEKAALIEPTRTYPPSEAIHLAKETSYARFDETVELHVRTGLDPRHAEQQLRGTALLPHGLGKTVRVLAFAEGEAARVAEEEGAEFVGADELIKKVEEGWTDFDVALAQRELMGKVGKLGRILGPRGLMPNPKTGTVTFDVAKAIKEIQAGKVDFRVDKSGIVHAPLGKLSFSLEALSENYQTLISALNKMKPSSSKGAYIKSVSLSSTMGVGIKVAHSAH